MSARRWTVAYREWCLRGMPDAAMARACCEPGATWRSVAERFKVSPAEVQQRMATVARLVRRRQEGREYFGQLGAAG